MKNKRIISLLLAFILFISCFSAAFSAFADEPRYFQRGVLTDGEKTAYWIIDKDNKVLYLSGDGVTNGSSPDYPSAAEGPFAGRKDVTRIVIEEDIAYVGAYTFANMTAVDTIEIQSNLLKSENSINKNAFSGDTGIRNVQGDSEVLSTNTLINAVKVGIGVVSGDWLSVVKNVINTGSDVISDDGTLDDESVDAMVNDYITTGERLFIGDMDEVISGYEERISNPCYTNNAFHHTYSEAVTAQPSCTENGTDTFTCSVCGDVYNETIPALGHTYVDEVFSEPTCVRRGVMERYCTVCGDSSFSAIPALGHTEAAIERIEPTCTSVGYTAGTYCTVCGEIVSAPEEIDILPHTYGYHYDENEDSYTAICVDCSDTVTEFENDTEALIEAESWFNSLDGEDYTAESYGALEAAASLHTSLTADDTLIYPQFIIDSETAEILTKISELKANLKLELESENGSAYCNFGETEYPEGTYDVVFGEDVTFTAIPDSGYKFIAWYDVNTLRYLSTASEYTIKLTSNLKLKAVFASTECSTLSFRGEGGQVKATYSYTPDEWDEIGGLEDILPPVPYKYGYTNGRWAYDIRTFHELENGNDMTIYAEYDELDVFIPELPESSGGTAPALTLSYVYCFENELSVGTLIMASNVPDGCTVETIGIAYIKKPAADFTPSDVNLTINNKATTARFEGISDSGLYILNIRNLNSKSNWAVKGYMTYYDENGELRIAYTNQINIVDKQSV